MEIGALSLQLARYFTNNKKLLEGESGYESSYKLMNVYDVD